MSPIGSLSHCSNAPQVWQIAYHKPLKAPNFPLIDKSSRLITIQLIDYAEVEMDIITIGTLVVISVCLGIAAIMILEPKWIQISYVTWSRPKKLIFSTVMYLPLVFLLEGSWLILLPTFVFMSFIMLDRQKHFISFKLRT